MATWDMYIAEPEQRIAVELPIFDTKLNKEIKELPGPVRWDAGRKVWTLPLRWEVCVGSREIANRWGHKIRIWDNLKAWASEEKLRQAEKPSVHSVELQRLGRLEQEFPHTWKAISSRPFQTVGAKFAAFNERALIADEPGLGKTLQTIAAVVEAGITGPILVVSLKSALEITWPSEIKRWLPGDKVTVINSSMKPQQRRDAVRFGAFYDHPQFDSGSGTKRHWILAGPDYIRIRHILKDGKFQYNDDGSKKIDYIRSTIPEMFNVEWSAIIVDESHRYLAGMSGNIKKQSAQRQGLGALKVREGGLKLALSGTPFRGKQENIWGTANWLFPDQYRSAWNWAEKHFDMYDDGFGTVIGKLIDEEKFYKELSGFMVRRTKREVAPELPPKVYAGEPLNPDDPTSPVAVWLPMSGPQAKAYREIVQDAAAELEGGELTANGVLAELTRLKQFACSSGKLNERGEFEAALPSNKFDWLIDFLEDRGIAGAEPTGNAKVIVASQFTRLLNTFYRELTGMGIECHILTGETSGSERIRMAEEFQAESGPRVFLLNTNAGGASITLDAADDVVMLDTTWNKDDQEQVEDRAHRVSRTDHTVTIWNLCSRDSIEEAIAIKTTAKDRDIKRLIDGSRGVEFAATLLNYLKDKK